MPCCPTGLVMSSTRRTDTSAKCVPMRASSMLPSRRRYRSIIAISKEISLSLGAFTETLPKRRCDSGCNNRYDSLGAAHCACAERLGSTHVGLCLQQLIGFFSLWPAGFFQQPLDYFLVQCYNLLGHGSHAPLEQCVDLHSIRCLETMYIP